MTAAFEPAFPPPPPEGLLQPPPYVNGSAAAQPAAGESTLPAFEAGPLAAEPLGLPVLPAVSPIADRPPVDPPAGALSVELVASSVEVIAAPPHAPRAAGGTGSVDGPITNLALARASLPRRSRVPLLLGVLAVVTVGMGLTAFFALRADPEETTADPAASTSASAGSKAKRKKPAKREYTPRMPATERPEKPTRSPRAARSSEESPDASESAEPSDGETRPAPRKRPKPAMRPKSNTSPMVPR